jgi:uncharacterized protein (DUF3820 family)
MKMPFGQFQGMELTEVPSYYLRWLRRREWLGAWLVQAIDAVLEGESAGRPEARVDPQRAGESKQLISFSIRHFAKVGQEILDQDGKSIAWTTDEWIAQVICKLFNENEELLRRSRS